MAFDGSYRLTQATARVKTANLGTPFPESGNLRVPSLMVTAVNSNAGTIYVKCSATTPGAGAATRETSIIPLTAGKSWTFTGVPIGEAAYRDIVFGTGFTYILGSATSQRVVLTYLNRI